MDGWVWLTLIFFFVFVASCVLEARARELPWDTLEHELVRMQCGLLGGVVTNMTFTPTRTTRHVYLPVDALVDAALARYQVKHGQPPGSFHKFPACLAQLVTRTLDAVAVAAGGPIVIANGCCSQRACPYRLFHETVLEVLARATDAREL